MGEDNRTLILILGIGLDPLHSFLLLKQPPPVVLSLPSVFPSLFLSPSSLFSITTAAQRIVSSQLSSQSVPPAGHQPFKPNETRSSLFLHKPSLAICEQARGAGRPRPRSPWYQTYVQLELHRTCLPPPFLGLSQYPVFTWRLTVAIIPTPHTSFSCPSQRGAIRSLTGLAFARIRLHTPRPVQTVHQSPTRCRSLDPICFPRLSDLVFSKFSLSPDPSAWGGDLSLNHAEADDYLHNPDPKRDRASDGGGHIFTARGLANLGCLATLAMAVITLLYALWFPVPRDAKTDHAPVPAIPSSLIFP